MWVFSSRRLSWRTGAAVIAVVAVHIGIVAMLTLGNPATDRRREPRPFQVRIIPLERPTQANKQPSARGTNTLRAREGESERSTAITYPPVPESAFDDAAAMRALQGARDCSAGNLARLTPEERERCAHVIGALRPGTGTGFTVSAEESAQWSDDVARHNSRIESPFVRCPGTDRDRLGLGCMNHQGHR